MTGAQEDSLFIFLCLELPLPRFPTAVKLFHKSRDLVAVTTFPQSLICESNSCSAKIAISFITSFECATVNSKFTKATHTSQRTHTNTQTQPQTTQINSCEKRRMDTRVPDGHRRTDRNIDRCLRRRRRLLYKISFILISRRARRIRTKRQIE